MPPRARLDAGQRRSRSRDILQALLRQEVRPQGLRLRLRIVLPDDWHHRVTSLCAFISSTPSQVRDVCYVCVCVCVFLATEWPTCPRCTTRNRSRLPMGPAVLAAAAASSQPNKKCLKAEWVVCNRLITNYAFIQLNNYTVAHLKST